MLVKKLILGFPERTLIEQGRKVGELVIPLARNFGDLSMDLEVGSNTSVSVHPLEIISVIWVTPFI